MGVETMFLHQKKQTAKNELASIEREHFGDPEKRTGIYAALASKPVPVMANGLTEEETSATASVSGLSSAPTQPVREPMSDDDIYSLNWPADVGGFDEVREIVRQAEAFHGITKE